MSQAPAQTTPKTAVMALAERLGMVDQNELKKILKKMIFPPAKADGREATDEELMALIVVANAYNLNPLTKEIYAFPDPKNGRIVPIVSTDGWNRLMTTHQEYMGHSYNYAPNMTTPEGGKPCFEWCECITLKKNGEKIIVREYLDEVYRPPFKGERGPVPGPWQSHTKRMLRHKTKIQLAREAYGFAGIYDEDEGERIIDTEGRVVPEPKALPKSSKPEVTDPKQIKFDPDAKEDKDPMTEQAQEAAPGQGEAPAPPEKAPETAAPVQDEMVLAEIKRKRRVLEMKGVQCFNKKEADFNSWLWDTFAAPDVNTVPDDQLDNAIAKLRELEAKKKDEGNGKAAS